MPNGLGSGSSARIDVQLVQDVLDVAHHRAVTDAERIADLAIGAGRRSAGDRHVQLTPGQAIGGRLLLLLLRSWFFAQRGQELCGSSNRGLEGLAADPPPEPPVYAARPRVDCATSNACSWRASSGGSKR